jgi:hypothetical protein
MERPHLGCLDNLNKAIGDYDMTRSVTETENIQTDRYLSEPDLAKHLGYSSSTIRRFRKKGLP